ncbi:MAG: sigma-70 family RNA polymerase sigma factor [Candidatus Omnitrophica bacterium]|nr:sigma-70 family RNA polymerase sigma factor [Candidatus Omnitrophota bacterium]
MEAIKLYLKEIKLTPLLTAEEEITLANRIKKGDKKARQRMIKANLRLVINIAKRYSYLGVPIMDLIEEGNLGLMKAVTKFNPKKGYRFSTYAAWWIKQYITRAIANQGKTIRVPIYMLELLMKFRKVSEGFIEKLNRKPKLGEIAKKMGLSIKKVQELNQIVAKISSLNAPVGEEGSTEFMELIEDDKIETAWDNLTDYLQQEKIKELLDKMSPRERKILTLRFGLKDGTPRTLNETAKSFGITRERVRQIELVAMKKLRSIMLAQEAKVEERIARSGRCRRNNLKNS